MKKFKFFNFPKIESPKYDVPNTVTPPKNADPKILNPAKTEPKGEKKNVPPAIIDPIRMLIYFVLDFPSSLNKKLIELNMKIHFTYINFYYNNYKDTF